MYQIILYSICFLICLSTNDLFLDIRKNILQVINDLFLLIKEENIDDIFPL